jgi:hypothetical protein
MLYEVERSSAPDQEDLDENDDDVIEAKVRGLVNGGKPCWSNCGDRSGTCSFCGTGKCCRKGFKPSGNCKDDEGGDENHVCVPTIEKRKKADEIFDSNVVNAKNENKNCWSECGEKAGSCSFCGTGKCCMQHFEPAGDCLPTEGGITSHVCVPKVEKRRKSDDTFGIKNFEALDHLGLKCDDQCGITPSTAIAMGKLFDTQFHVGYTNGNCNGKPWFYEHPGFENEGKECRKKCGSLFKFGAGPCPRFCGTGHCCRKGDKKGGCTGTNGGKKAYECIRHIEMKYNFCGSGKCCKLNDYPANDCGVIDGKLDEHVCVPTVVKKKTDVTKLDPMQGVSCKDAKDCGPGDECILGSCVKVGVECTDKDTPTKLHPITDPDNPDLMTPAQKKKRKDEVKEQKALWNNGARNRPPGPTDDPVQCDIGYQCISRQCIRCPGGKCPGEGVNDPGAERGRDNSDPNPSNAISYNEVAGKLREGEEPPRDKIPLEPAIAKPKPVDESKMNIQGGIPDGVDGSPEAKKGAVPLNYQGKRLKFRSLGETRIHAGLASKAENDEAEQMMEVQDIELAKK